MKAQLLVSQENKMIYGVVSGKGKTHDFKMFRESRTHIAPDVKILGDSGYQGIKDIHTNSRTPVKKTKGKKLTKRQKLYNYLLSKKRIVIKNVIRHCKIFRITKDVYRGKHKNHGKIWNLVAKLVNLRYEKSII